MTPAARVLFTAKRDRLHRQTDRMFLWLLLVQWVVAIVIALALTPWSYEGPVRSIHFHVKAAIGFGALLNSLPVALIYLRPGWWGTRHVVAFTQMMWSALLIMITGGRIETHFHIFGSLAFLAFYADWRILVTATVTVAGDHLFRGLFWPDSVYGLANPEWWRFVEHATWVAFEDLVLVFGCYRTMRELRVVATHEALLEETNALIEHRVEERTTELAESMERFRALVENSDAIPFEYDSETHRILYVAPQIARLLEAETTELNDQLFATALHPDDRVRVRDTIRAFARGAALPGDPIDFRVITTAGRVRHARTLLSDRLAGTRVRGIILDVTKQRLLEDELRQAQKLESVGRLAAGVAHEINTPIQFVSDSVQFARDAIVDLMAITDKYRAASDGILDGTAGSSDRATAATTAANDGDLAYIVAEIPKALDRALEGTSRVATIVRSMKSFAHHDRAAAERIDLNDAVLSTLTVARGEYKYVAELELDCQPIPPVTCWVGEINQVVLNLVINAAHAIKHKHGDSGVLGVIRVSTRCEDGRVTISIADSGTGIPEDVRDHLFEPFFTTKAVGEGTGQGLALARAIVVDKHHGSLTFDTALGEGSTFHLCIPVQQPNAAESAA